MKRANRLLGLQATMALFLALPFAAQADDDDWSDDDDRRGSKKPTIAEIVAASGGEFDQNGRDFDILLNAVSAAGLVDALNDPNDDLTVLAPDDLAFISLARDLGYEGSDEQGAFEAIVAALTEIGEGDPIPTLRFILLYHVLPESKFAFEVIFSGDLHTASGETILAVGREIFDAEPELQNPILKLRRSDIRASNGLIQVISRVLIPVDLPNTPDDAPTITEIVAASGLEYDNNGRNFNILLNAVVLAGLDDELNDLDNLTVFAPDDFAFIRTARSLGYRGRDEAGAFGFIAATLTELGDGDPLPLLEAILLYHVLGETISFKDALGAHELETLLGATIRPNDRRIALRDNERALRDPRVKSFASDIRASNGLIHTITRVLIPVDLSEL